MNLLPHPRSLKRRRGSFLLPARATLHLDAVLKPAEARTIANRLQHQVGVQALACLPRRLKPELQHFATPTIRAIRTNSAPAHAGGYVLTIDQRGVLIEFCEIGGLRAAVATLRQIFREYGRRLPRLKIRDWPDFPRRGVMLDISRGRVPKLKTLLDLVEQLADFKINEFQLYTEHTFAFRKFKPVWRSWGALTSAEIRQLDARCRELGIDLVPNQNSFGHLREWLAHPPLKKLAEVPAPYESDTGDFVRHPSTLAPNHPGTLPLLRRLYDELLPNFTSRYFNVGCDETWDLGRGQSKQLCERRGKGRVYLDFLKKIHREVAKRGKRMMFWGDIILKYPKLIPELASFGVPPSGGSRRPPKGGTPNLIALNWGYEADHPFKREAALFAKSKIPFYACPGTSTWMTLIGRHDNAFANLRRAAEAGRRHGAVGYLITDWGDGGHPQPLAVSWLPYLFGASVSWCAASFDALTQAHKSVRSSAFRRQLASVRTSRLKAELQTETLAAVLSRDVFHDRTGNAVKAARALGFAHLKFGYKETNQTPLGAVIAAPPPETREMVCRNGLKYYARIPAKNVRAALAEIQRQRDLLSRSRPASRLGKLLVRELDLAARMAAQSCHFMLWQQAFAARKMTVAKRLAKAGIEELRQLDCDFNACWPLRNKGTTAHCSAFLRWRIRDYECGSWSSGFSLPRQAEA